MTAGSGWLPGVRRVLSPNSDSRPPGVPVDLAILHCISLPRGVYGSDAGGDAIEQLFTNRLDPAAHPSFADLAGLRVSAHFLIRRSGSLVQFVPLEARAWHAGRSRWRGRERCNDVSVGIELEGVDDGAFTGAQYGALAALLGAVRARLPLRQVAGHREVAPGRKSDPGARFDWPRLLTALARS
jgi:N-acetyl-anhydromuramoyl-L-alanine amidase